MDLIGAQIARPRNSWLREIWTYLVHFLVGVVGVFIVSMLLARILNSSISTALFDGPVFFGEVGLGFLAGFAVNGKLRSKSAMLVWVLPAVWLVAAIVSAFGSLYGAKGWGVIFGTKCGDCLDQLLTVCPFYVSVAYSLGAWAGRSAQS